MSTYPLFEYKETVEEILREMREPDVRLSCDEISEADKRALRYACDWTAGYADRIERALAREQANVN